MSQNTSSAVMAQRHEAHDSLDFFPTPPWATRALCEFLEGLDPLLADKTCEEPACGEGHMARPLREYFAYVDAADVHGYGFGKVRDFLFPDPDPIYPDWVITNPPFRLGAEFIERGLERAREGVAMLVRTVFLESADRYTRLYDNNRPTHVLQFVERVPMVKGRLDKTASSATSYCWLIWTKPRDRVETILGWIPPCRKRLEKASDYA